MKTLPLDGQLAAVLPHLDFGAVEALTPGVWRGFLKGLAATSTTTPLASVHDVELAAPGNALRARVYRAVIEPQPTVVFFHGGGWVGGDLDTHDELARRLAIDLRCALVSVEYRRPPEAPYPAPWNDAIEATRFVAAHQRQFGGEGQPLAVCGDSAGANLAAAAAIAARDEGLQLAGQLLLCPVTDLGGGLADGRFPSRRDFASGYFISTELLRWCALQAVPVSRWADPTNSVLRAASLRGVAPAVIATAQYDPTRDEARAFASALAAARVDVQEFFGAGLIHAYFAFEAHSEAAAVEALAVRRAFARLLKR